MAENNQTPEPTADPNVVVKKARVRTFINNHPRTAKVVGFTAGAVALLGAGAAAKSLASKTDVDYTPGELEVQFNSSPEATPATEA